jgi:glycosyltransferase involved in cell wall biosynthesis
MENLRDHREQLALTLESIRVRGTPLSEIEIALLLDSADARLKIVEAEFNADGYRRIRRWGPRQFRPRVSRMLGLPRPRIGSLRHYKPRPLVLPTSYLNVAPPDAPPTISIVTPSFQQARFLERTLHSVVSQEYPALEYIVQDGGSTDGTLDVLHRYATKLTDWVSEPDGGQADAINRGFARSTGEIMAYLNSDDLLLPGSLAHVGRFFDEHPDVDVVYGNRLLIDEADGEIGKWILPDHDDTILTLADYIPQETLFWRRRIWDKSGGFLDRSFGYALDWDLLLRFRDADAVMVHLPRFIGAFRVHEAQKTTTEDALGLEECARLRARVHGRPVRQEEVLIRQQPYMRRHVIAHTRHRLADRIPKSRVRVRTLPLRTRE